MRDHDNRSKQMIVSMNKRARDPLLGKEVIITGGPYKGHRGKVA